MNATLNTTDLLSGLFGCTEMMDSSLFSPNGQDLLSSQDLSFFTLLSSELELVSNPEAELNTGQELPEEFTEEFTEELLLSCIPLNKIILDLKPINPEQQSQNQDLALDLNLTKQVTQLEPKQIEVKEIELEQVETEKLKPKQVEFKQAKPKQAEAKEFEPKHKGIEQTQANQQTKPVEINGKDSFVTFNSKELEAVVPLENMIGLENVNNTESEPTEKLQVHQQIAREIEFHTASNISKGEIKEFSMDLYPKELGKINVRFKLDQGKLSIDIASVKTETHKLLTSQIDKLVDKLGLSNFVVENLQVVQSKEGSSILYENQNLQYGDQFQREADQEHKQNQKKTKFKNKKYADFISKQAENNKIDKIEDHFHKMNYII